jgi:uncharacterized protein YlxP (DUF503 family)
MYVAALTLDVLLGDVRSLKQKRGVVRPLVAELRRRYPGIAVAETGHLDLHRRAEIGAAAVSDTAGNATKLLDECERIVASHPEIELLSARHRLYNEEELPAINEVTRPGRPFRDKRNDRSLARVAVR